MKTSTRLSSRPPCYVPPGRFLFVSSENVASVALGGFEARWHHRYDESPGQPLQGDAWIFQVGSFTPKGVVFFEKPGIKGSLSRSEKGKMMQSSVVTMFPMM